MGRVVDDKNDQYPVTVSDWIVILHGKSSIDQTRIIFVISVLLAFVVATPVLATKYFESSLVSMSFILAVFLLFVLVVYYTIRRGLKNSRPYIDLYDRIIQGKLTDPRKILEEYEKIQKRE